MGTSQRHGQRTGLFRRLVQGTVGGVAATASMSLVLGIADWLGAVNRQPPRMIVATVLPDLPDDETNTVAALAHVGYGATAGAVYGALVRPESRNMRSGILYGLLIWAASYEGWLPLLGVLPPAHRDKRGRAASMFFAHIVYGATLGLAARRAARSKH